MDILKKIEMYRQGEEKLKWEGTFREYLDIVSHGLLNRHIRVYII